MPDDATAQPPAPTGASAAPRPRPPWWWVVVALVVVAGLVAVGVRYAAEDDGVTAPTVRQTPSASATEPAPELTTEPTVDATADPASWERRDTLNTARDDFGTVVIDDQIWITGGMTGARGNKLNSTEIYDPGTDRWSFGPAMPTARSSLTTVVVDGIIYAIGGARADVPILDIVEALDTTTGTWTRLNPMPTARYEHGSVVVDGKVWIIGGNAEGGPRGSGPSGSVEIFDPATNTWSEGPSLAQPRSSLRTAVLDGKIYAVGGLAEDGMRADVEVYDPAVGEWQTGPTLPEKILNFGLTTYDGELHAVYHRHHFVLGPGDTEWRDEGSPPIIRHGIGLIGLDGMLYAIGGCTEDPLVDVNNVQVWQG